MSTPGNTDTPSFADRVNEVVSSATVDESGNLQLPDDIEADEAVLYAAKLEKQRRDTQSSYTKAQQRAKQLEAENNKLAEKWQEDALKNLSIADQAEMEELKLQDPDAWREKMNELEEEQRNKFTERRQSVSQEAQQLTELELREQQLEEFNKANPDFQITDDVIDNDIPPRLTKQLENGDITFDEFLNKAKDYVQKPKAIKGAQAPNDPNLGEAAGGHKPSEQARKKQMSNDYNQEIF